MTTHGWFRIVKFGLLGAAAVALGGYIVMSLWNALVPVLFHGPSLRFWQALGVLVLSRLLFGRIGGRSGHRMGWAGGMGRRWQHLTDEERAAVRERFGGRCGPRGAEVTEPKA